MTNIGPGSKSVDVGVDDAVVVGMENATGKTKAGEPRSFDNLVTDIFERDGDKWLMVSHHAQTPPK